jgi:hypothetical protein
MIDVDRVKLMTRMASYENTQGKENKKIGNYFRSDYLAAQSIKSFIYGTVAFLIGLAIYIVYDLEVFLSEIYDMDLLAFGKSVLTYYVIFIAVYVLLSLIYYIRRYSIARKSLRHFYNNLKKLSNYYEVMDEE